MMKKPVDVELVAKLLGLELNDLKKVINSLNVKNECKQ